MCGIAGIISRNSTVDESALKRMIAPIAYRGPDGDGYHCLESNTVGFAHRRLSILDTRAIGRQPMNSACGRYWVTFNGEIYNYLELKKELLTAGYSFKTETDTEVLIYAYAHWGRACLDHFIGMFAFALWDNDKKELFAARDRLGIKPFYYLLNNDRFYFASEIKSILAVIETSPDVDETLIDSYMSFGYVPGEETLFKGINRLLPGHALAYSQKDSLNIFSYWDLSFDHINDKGVKGHVNDVDQILTDSINLRLRSDVPLGVFLSGGLDSSAVVSLLSPGASSGLKTFSVAYDFGAAYDETPYAQEVSQKFNTDHHETRMSPQQFVDFIPQYIRHMDEPVTEAAAISLYYVSKLAREQVVVCLSGEGSDELFAGYDFYAYNLAIEKMRSLLGMSGSSMFSALGRKISRSQKINKYLDMLEKPFEERYKGISSYDVSVKNSLYQKNFFPVVKQGNTQLGDFLQTLNDKSKSWDPLSRMLYFDTKTWLVDDLLIKADRMSMATSIELRVPFLDHRLVELAASIPSKYKMRGFNPKYVLKQLLKSRLPESIIKRKKMGFPTPLETMFRGDLYDYAHDTLLSEQSVNRGYFDRTAIESLLADHRGGKAQNHREIWQLVVLEEWHRQFNY
ncbi:asparagine synthase (glutamine-hydrolyzing) [uncultured Desulfuromusa sp.]|uniref:asparagine synthase (glutamine-hydrolyzing) n=1 Tax=uncultured Desulfuromusa sp. TaxID=219183 RepID=UPI002AA91853|nr:asparagine synthase (glutamine-hydrolyzing) [uncultured Desulfuromusa sp.]